jgi:predicted protein tyrosine phosphatase
MIEIYPNLFIGNEIDFETKIRHELGWSIVHACKEPYHRQALGYTGRAVPKTHPEYLIARRGNRLILNIVDAPDPAYIPKEIIDAALEFISISLTSGDRVLVHCNEGCSRSASIGLMYLVKFTDRLHKGKFLEAEAAYRTIYPQYNPKSGMRGFMMGNWGNYCLI